MGDNHNHLAELLAQAQQAVANAAQAAQGYFQSLGPDPSEHEPVGQVPQPVTRKVLNVIYNPHACPSSRACKLSEVMGWNDPDQLIAGHMADLKQVSHGYANFVTAERVEVDRFPVKADGFAYTPDDFVESAARQHRLSLARTMWTITASWPTLTRLVTEDAARPRAGPVTSVDAVVEDLMHQREVLLHRLIIAGDGQGEG